MEADALRPEAAGQGGELVVRREAGPVGQLGLEAIGIAGEGGREGLEDDPASGDGGVEGERRDAVLTDLDQAGDAIRQRGRRRPGGWRSGGPDVRSCLEQVGQAQVDVLGVELVRLDGERLERLEGGDPLGAQPVGLGAFRGECLGEAAVGEPEREVGREPSRRPGGRGAGGRWLGGPGGLGRPGRHPSDPSISSLTRRLNSMAYSIGSSLVNTSRKPWTMRLVASFSVRPRLIR
jgi:hypothetical protein